MEDKLTKNQLIEIATKIKFSLTETEFEEDLLLEKFSNSVPDPNILSLFRADLDPSEIVEKALSYKPIQL